LVLYWLIVNKGYTENSKGKPTSKIWSEKPATSSFPFSSCHLPEHASDGHELISAIFCSANSKPFLVFLGLWDNTSREVPISVKVGVDRSQASALLIQLSAQRLCSAFSVRLWATGSALKGSWARVGGGTGAFWGWGRLAGIELGGGDSNGDGEGDGEQERGAGSDSDGDGTHRAGSRPQAAGSGVTAMVSREWGAGSDGSGEQGTGSSSNSSGEQGTGSRQQQQGQEGAVSNKQAVTAVVMVTAIVSSEQGAGPNRDREQQGVVNNGEQNEEKNV
jgi:hypothetical protein